MIALVRNMAQGPGLGRQALAWAVVILLPLYLGRLYLEVQISLVNGVHPLGPDFVSFWSAARAVWAGEPLLPYDFAAFSAWQKTLLGFDNVAFFYPPSWLLYVAPFGLLPYSLAVASFELLSLTAAAVSLRALLGGRDGWWLALMFPALLYCVLHGQNSLLNLALLGGAIACLLRERGWVAGVLIGLMAYKPHFGILIPFALLAGREYRTFLGAALTATGVAIVSVVVFGVEAWQAFAAQAGFARETLDAGYVEIAKMVSVYAWLRQLGLDAGLAMAAQLCVSVGVLLAVVWVWHASRSMPLKGALLAAGACLATPFMLDYDMALLAIPVVLLVRMGLEERFAAFETGALALAIALTFFSTGYGMELPFTSGPLPALVLFTVLMRRHLRAIAGRGAGCTAARAALAASGKA